MAVLARLVVLLALVLVGLLARRVGVLDRTRTGWLNGAAFYVALPALVFVSTYDRRPAELASPALVGGLWLTFAAVVGLAWFVHRRERTPARRSVAVVQSYHCNFGYIGLPIVSAALGSAAAGRASVILGVGALTQIPLTIALLVWMNDADATIARQVRRLATNPVVLALVLGLTVATLGVSPPGPALDVLEPLSLAALPLALLGVGASLERAREGDGADVERVGGVLGLKLLAMPAIAWLAFTTLGAGPIAVAAGVVMLGAPSAVSSYIYAEELGGDAGLASTNVFATTLVGLVTLSLLVVLVG